MWKIDNGSTTGTTTASYADALGWNTRELSHKTILLKNTDTAQSLEYKLLGYTAEGGIAKELVAETTLAHGDIAEFHYEKQWHRLVLQLVDGSGHATYQVDYEGQGA